MNDVRMVQPKHYSVSRDRGVLWLRETKGFLQGLACKMNLERQQDFKRGYIWSREKEA